jgi:hypothetical protein
MPRRIRTTVRTAVQGYLPSASAAAGYAYIYANSFYEPFNTSNAVNTSNFGLSLTDGTSVSNNPTTYAFWASGYQLYRVYSSKLSITAVTGAAGDSMNVWMYPISLNDSVPTANLQRSSGQPGFKRMMITSGMRPSTITCSIRPSQVLGYTDEEYRTSKDSESPFGAAPATDATAIFIVDYATMDGGVTSQQVYFEFCMTQDIEVFQVIQPNS